MKPTMKAKPTVKAPVNQRGRLDGWDYSDSDYGVRTFYVNGIAIYFERMGDR